MATQAKLLSNHYDVLGLSPTASQDEIAAAFAAALNRLAAQPMAAKLPLYEAFGILRQPDKRKAYDRSIGLEAEPVQTTFLVPSRAAFSFAADARGTDLEQVVKAGETSPPTVHPQAKDEAELDQLVEQIRAQGHAEKAALHQVARQPQDWRRLGIAAGVLIVGAGLFGGIAGVSASGPSTPEDALAETRLPAPSAYLKGSAPSRELGAEAEAEVSAENETAAQRLAALDRKVDRLVIPPEVEAAVSTPALVEAEHEREPAAPTADPLAPQPEPEVQTAAGVATMPLPKATIARTIEKIGYPCGAVASVAPVDGGGVFKVSCSSGHSYRAAPTAGRYRFKKWRGA